MDTKIYDSKSKEYVSYGHYIFDNEDYYSLEQYKSEFLFRESTREENQQDSSKLIQYRSFPVYRTKPETGKDEFILVYNIDLLNDLFSDEIQ